MKPYNYFLLLLTVLFIFSMVSCTPISTDPPFPDQEDDLPQLPDNVAVSDKDKKIFDIVTRRYTDAELQEIYDLNCDLSARQYETFESFNAVYPAECVRETIVDGEIIAYCVNYWGETKVLTVSLSKNTSKQDVMSFTMHTLHLAKADFDSLVLYESTMEDVRLIDPLGTYWVLSMFRGWDSSVHYTTDGYDISISYTADHIIRKISIELI